MKSSRSGVAVLLVGTWGFGEYGVYMLLDEAARVAREMPLGVNGGLADEWYFNGAALYLTSAFAVFLIASLLDVLGAPAWHRVAGFTVSMTAFTFLVVPNLMIENGLLALPPGVWVARALVVLLALASSAVIAPRLRTAGSRLPTSARVGVAVGLFLTYTLYFMPALYTRGPGLPPGRYEDVLLERVSFRGGIVRAGINMDLESVRDKLNAFESDKGTTLIVQDDVVTFDEFREAYRLSRARASVSVDDTGTAAVIELLSEEELILDVGSDVLDPP